MRHFTLLVSALLLLASPSASKDLKVHGFVTAVNSPTSFEIDDYKITHDLKLTLVVKKDKSDPAVTTFNPEDIRVGTELEITGDYNESTHELRAGSVEVFLFDTVRIDRVALLQEAPSLEKSNSGAWHGTLSADERILVSEATVITLKQNADENDLQEIQNIGGQRRPRVCLKPREKFDSAAPERPSGGKPIENPVSILRRS
jgi:hypothetical protein